MQKAFTMVELLMVIVVTGILVAVALPRLNEDSIYQAANQVTSHIRYTQHLAMQDDKFNPRDSQWYKGRWQIHFYPTIRNTTKCKTDMMNAWAYSVYSDKPNYTGNPNIAETARNPQNPNQLLSGGFNNTICIDNSENAGNAMAMSSLRLGEKFGIKYIRFLHCGGARRVAFDSFGRPIVGNQRTATSSYQKRRVLKIRPCEIWLCTVEKDECESEGALDSADRVKIMIEPETGFVRAVYEN